VNTTTRTDVHRPSASEFDPQAYDCVGVFDADSLDSNVTRGEIVSDLCGQGYTLGHGSNTQCGHCGTHLRYSALLVRDDIQQFIFVGETCLDNRFQSLTKDEFQRLREEARLNRERANSSERIEALAQEHECVQRLVANDRVVQQSSFLSDVRRKFLQGGRLSPAQLSAIERTFAGVDRREKWEAERAAERARLQAAGVKAPAGRVKVTGKVVSVKDHTNNFGTVPKATIKTDEGWTLWVTLPSSVDRDCVGRTITLEASIKPSDRDPAFAFGSRPTKASILS
jgi:hypothetical protein